MSDGWLDIERIYCFDWDAFDRDDMDRLRAIFASLPQSKKHDAHDCHWWYAEQDDPEHGYLTAGVEPPGLQVFGTLPLREWEAWDRAFQERAAGLPVRQVS
ncbi:MAG: hypothetical protein R3B84_20760 [Zavarzinella sp.]